MPTSVKTKKRDSLATRIIISITVLTSLLLCIVGSVLFARIKKINGYQFTGQLANTMRLMDQSFTAYLGTHSKTVGMLATIAESEPEGIEDIAEHIVDSDEDIISAGIVTEAGEILCYPYENVTQEEADIWYQTAVDFDGYPRFSELYKKADGTLVVCGTQSYYGEDGVGGVDSKWLWGWGYAPINWDRFMLAVLGTFGVNLTANFHSETAEIPTTKGNVVGVDALELALALYATVGATVQAIYRISDHFGIFGSVHMYTNPIGAGLFGYIYDGGDGYGEGDADGGRIGFGGFDFAARFGLSFTY